MVLCPRTEENRGAAGRSRSRRRRCQAKQTSTKSHRSVREGRRKTGKFRVMIFGVIELQTGEGHHALVLKYIFGFTLHIIYTYTQYMHMYTYIYIYI